MEKKIGQPYNCDISNPSVKSFVMVAQKTGHSEYTNIAFHL